MRSAIFIEDGVTQVVLTPENETDRSVVSQIEEAAKQGALAVHRGTFYQCQGGWTIYEHGGWMDSRTPPSSLMLRVASRAAGGAA